ncbi:MAG: recombination protein RecR [Clostridia bacterium]|nr:recombination protein RecR [Clostridia bacterium]MBR6005907.1 recombination protein RecR [Clostridia bacterium]
MDNFAAPLEELIDSFASLPSIGRKSAQRLAFHVLSMDDASARKFIDSVTNARSKIHRCPVCCNLTDKDICSICSSPSRNKSTICVVENPKDVIAIEKTHEYNGVYHVLHGAISPLNDIGVEDICAKELILRLQDDSVKEIIMATNTTVEGEATAVYLSHLLKPIGVKVTRLAYGVPVGADLEYADEVTLVRAIEGRQEL